LGTFWLKIEQFWPFEEISIFSNGGHLGWRAGLSDTILKGTHPRTIPARFGLIWFSGFNELFNIYYWIFYELWTFADFDRLCKLGINKQKIISKSSC
jgi:hypothetical protein